MSDFKWRHYQGDVILGCVRWYYKYGISYRDLEEMMLERGVEVDHTTIYRWQPAPETAYFVCDLHLLRYFDSCSLNSL